MFKKILISFSFLPLISPLFGQDTSKVVIDTFSWDTTGLYYFLNNQTNSYDFREEKGIISDSVFNVISERLPKSLGLELRDTLDHPLQKMVYKFHLETDRDGYYSIPSNLERWSYHIYMDLFFELVYLKISSENKFSCLSINVYTESDVIWDGQMYWRAVVRIDLE